MGRDARPGGELAVDFVIGENPAPDPAAPPVHRARRRGRGAGRSLLALAAVGLAVITVARLTPSHDPPPPPLPSVASIAPLPADPAQCRTGVACTTVHDAPPAFDAAVTAAFPGVRRDTVDTIVADDGYHAPFLWSRTVQMSTRALNITVRIAQPRVSDRGESSRTLDGIGRVVTLVSTHARGFRVDMTVSTRDAAPPSYETLYRLAEDRRLAVLQ